jgi:hypothetical protein
VRRSGRLSLALLGLLAGCNKGSEAPAEAPWRPGTVYASTPGANARGFLDRRGLIHAHSIYSHDACDGEPVKDGVRDTVCFDDFRRGLCQARHDFVMLTDHPESFSATPYPEALLYRADRGDALVERAGAPVASWASCPDGSRALIMAGFEGGTMSVGLERHALEDEAARDALYRDVSAETVAAVKAVGGLTVLAHTEDWTVDELVALPIDGFEMYNLHANSFLSAGTILEMLILSSERPEALPHPDLIFLPLFSEDPRYLERWGSVLARGARRVTTMGTDCHRNSFPALLPDGERADSYRRMMLWFSNHLLVRPEADGAWDDRHVKDALQAGRLYGVFEILGTPDGFDYFAEVGGEVAEMGSEVPFASAPQLRITAPTLRNPDPGVPAPKLTVRLLRAKEGGFEEVVRSASSLAYSPTGPGVYRAEVRIEPLHLAADLGQYRLEELADFVWIYSNPIYVR